MKILLIVIDAATPHVVCPAVRTGRLPTLQRLVDAGTMHERSVSIFPSITPAATTSIVTGAYPAEHGTWVRDHAVRTLVTSRDRPPSSTGRDVDGCRCAPLAHWRGRHDGPAGVAQTPGTATAARESRGTLALSDSGTAGLRAVPTI